MINRYTVAFPVITIEREEDKYNLYKAKLQGLYALSNGKDVSVWFEEDTALEVLKLSKEEFIKECKEII